MKKWRIEDSEELYNIKGWGVNYFGINEKGHAFVSPRKDGVRVDLKELVDDLALRDKVNVKTGTPKKEYFNALRKEILTSTDALYEKLSAVVKESVK